MGKRYMTLDDLYNFYLSQGENQKFSQTDEKDTIVVRANGKLNFSKDESMEGLYPVRIQMNFVGDNLNGSRIEMKAQEKALPSSMFRPLLGYIHDVDGEPQFYGHNMEIDEDGNPIYIEQPVGVIAEKACIEHDDDYDMDYAVALGFIWEEYSKAAYIIERDQRCDVSVELAIRELSFNAKDKILVLDDFYYSGCTILGYDDEGNKVNPAMPGSNVTLADFTTTIKEFSIDEKLVETLDKLNETLSKFNIQAESSADDNSGKEGKQVTFEALLEKYGKTAEDITFEIEGLSDEELEAAFAEAFEEVEEPEETPENTEGEAQTTEDNADGETEPSTEDENPEGTDDDSIVQNSAKFTIEENGITRNFSISLNDKIYALQTLVNDTYSEQDCDWYYCDVFEDSEKYVVMHGWSRSYRQQYKCKNDTYSLVGDRVEVFATYLTADEQKAFDKMKADFAEVSDKLSKYESESEKMEILNSEDYGFVAETEEFAELKKQENHFNLSVEDVKKSADEILLKYVKSGSFNFAKEDEKKVAKKIATPIKVNTKKGRYGNLFKN